MIFYFQIEKKKIYICKDIELGPKIVYFTSIFSKKNISGI